VPVLDDRAKAALAHLIARDDTLSALAVLRQDAKDFRWRQMAREREKRALLDPVYQIAKALVPTLGISQQNLRYDASLATFYTVYDLRRLRPEQTHLYLLCYAWLRYRQLTDNLVDALAYHLQQLEDACSAAAKKAFDAEQLRRQQETPQVGRLLALYVDETEADATPFGDVRQRAYTIMPKDALARADSPTLYEKCLIRPAGQIDLQAIIDEKPHIDRIVATLGLKEMTQGTLIRKLCTYTTPNPTRRAIFEFDKLIRSIYTLHYGVRVVVEP
jgi:uncharacterized protein YukE